MHDLVLTAFKQELIKLGGPTQLLSSAKQVLQRAGKSPTLQRGLGGLGAGFGVGSAGGALVGAGVGGVRSYREAKEQGATGGTAAAQALTGGLTGAAKGALIGGAAGGAALGTAAAKGIAPELAGRLTRAKGVVGASARFGQRQVHSVTGWTPKGFHSPEGLREIRGGAYGASEAHRTAREKFKALGPNASPAQVARGERALASTHKSLEAQTAAERMGLTSIPGYAKALAKSPVKALKTGLGAQWHTDTMGKAMMALPVAAAAKELGTSDKPGGPGRFERAGRSLSTLGYSMGPLPIVGSSLVGGAVGSGLQRVGRLADQKKKRPEQSAASTLEPAGGAAMASDKEYSPSASGQQTGFGNVL